ncbi:MAG: hypothetical protein R3C09_18785 [Pirellulaceae bacterium]
MDADSVTYQYMPSKTHTLLTRTVTGQSSWQASHSIARFRKVRYHGWMTSNSKARLEEIRVIVWMALSWIYWLASGHAYGPSQSCATVPLQSLPRPDASLRSSLPSGLSAAAKSAPSNHRQQLT